MVNRGVLAKNYYIDPEAVAALGADIERVMTEADQAMEEASEIIAGIALLTERVPAEIRCSELLDLCGTAQAEIKSFDFLSYGKRVNQGLLNLIDHNQYITENFIRKMRANTERAKRIGEEFRSLTDMITYSGGSVPMKGTAFSAVDNAEVKDTGSKEGNFRRRENREGTEQTTAADMIRLDGVLLRTGIEEAFAIDEMELENWNQDIMLANVSIEAFEQKLQVYEHYNVDTYEDLCNYLDLLLSEHLVTRLEYEELKRYISDLRNMPSDAKNINRKFISELLTNRKEFINSIDNKIEEAYNNISSDNPRTIVEYTLLNECRNELLDGIMTVEELEEVINILERKNPEIFTNIGILHEYYSGECDRLVQKIIEPYIFATEHVSVRLLNQLNWAYVNEEHVSELRLVMVKYDITTVERLRHFLAQCDAESGISGDLLEIGHGAGKSYSPYYGAGRIQLTHMYGYYAFAIYEVLEYYPELKERIEYPNPMHNDTNTILTRFQTLCDEADKNGLDISEFMNIVDEDNGPIYVAENYAWESAGYFWYINGCNEVVDSFNNTNPDNADAITNLINRYAPINQYQRRRDSYNEIKQYIQ